MITAESAGAILTIDLDAVVDNWRLLKSRLRNGADCGAVVKANAYGLGVDKVAPALARAGCISFFVATLDEGIELRGLLPDPDIYVLGGPFPGTDGEFLRHGLIPVLNAPEQVSAWRRSGKAAPCALHIDTGMGRLGLTAAEFETFLDQPEGLSVVLLMSHLACAEEPAHPKNRAQLSIFTRATHALPGVKASLVNSSGILLGEDWCFDLARPGAALYGVNPRPNESNIMSPVVRLKGRVVQVRAMHAHETVGYGATYTLPGERRIATVAVGYADGFPRSASGRAVGYVGDLAAPLVGRVSMDLTTFDVTDIPPETMKPGAWIDLIGPRNPVDILAAQAGTIGYEILTSLGRRYFRRTIGG